MFSFLKTNQCKIVFSAFFMLLFILTAPMAFAASIAGDYIKDDRKLDEVGLKATISVEALSGGKADIQMTIANPALCGGAMGGIVPVKGRRAVIIDGDCTLELVFSAKFITVTEKSGPCMAGQCPWSGTYVRYGAMVKSEKEIIKNIRAHYAYINGKLGSFDKLEKELEGFSTGGGTLESYYYMDHVKKIVVRLFGEMGKTLEEYYFWDDTLVFSFHMDSHYDKPFGSVVKKTENRYYFHYGRMIRWLDPKKAKVKPSNPDYGAASEKILLRSTAFSQLSKLPKKVVGRDDLQGD